MSHKVIISITLLLAAIFTAPNVIAATSLINDADQAYMNDNFERALELYTEASEQDGVSSNLYYNIGNCYYRLGNMGKAIVNYERALKLDPSNSDAAANLSFVNSRIVDKPVDNASLTEKIGERILGKFTSDTWAWITFGLFALFIAATAGYIFLSAVIMRKTCFFSGLVLIVLTIGGIVLTLTSARRTVSTENAIIITESVNLGTSPRVPKDKSEEAFLLHEGTRLQIVDSLTTNNGTTPTKWYEVKVDRDHRAWINSDNVEKI